MATPLHIAIGSDHAGFQLKLHLKDELGRIGYTFTDVGADTDQQPSDYPDYAIAVAEAVARGAAQRGIVVCGSGAGACIAAGKVRGIRATLGEDTYTAHQSVEHDDANVLCLGQRITGVALALEIARAFLSAEFTAEERHQRRLAKVTAYEAAHGDPVRTLSRQGQSLWLDNISREMFASGQLRRLAWDDGVVGMTSNPTIFEKAMGHSPLYAAAAEALARQGKSTEEIYWALAVEDIQAAADIMRPIYVLTDGLDGYISLEVSPAVANDTAGTLRMAQDLWQRVARPNLMVKIPATDAGVPAIEAAIASGVNINVTLMFSVPLYEQVANAYIRGLERFFGGGEATRLTRSDSLVPAPVSVASFFVSRVDTLVDKLLGEKLAGAAGAERERLEPLLGRAAIANARLAYARFKQIFAGSRWESLAARGARVQRPLWASTSTKNPRYWDVLYVEDLIGPDTVNTVPDQTLEAFKDHGLVSRTLDAPGVVEQARDTMQALAAAGIDMEAVTLQLQREGVKAFADSFDQLLATLESRRRTLVGAR